MNDRITRSVHPRKRNTNALRPIVAVTHDHYLLEDGSTGPLDDFVSGLIRQPEHIIASINSAELLSILEEYWSPISPSFDYRVTPIDRELFNPRAKEGHRGVLHTTAVQYVGWRNSSTKSRRAKAGVSKPRSVWHLMIDPHTFSNFMLPTTDEGLDMRLLKWAMELREFCVRQEINLRPTQGATARQFLQDQRFYPHPRRKVPADTNERVRKFLPGNYYEVRAEISPSVQYNGDYLDQSRCHHYHAMETPLPDADTLQVFGHFHEHRTDAWRKGPRIASFLAGFYGMVCGYLSWPKSERLEGTPFVPQYLRRYDDDPDAPYVFFSADMPLLESLGVTVTGIIFACGSKDRDMGIPAYAKWALAELGDNPPQWKKTLLLSVYGSLAIRKRTHTTAYHRSTRGERSSIRAGNRHLTVRLHRTARETEPSTNNVLHRALIESATRTESLMYANYLQSLDYDVLCIYADGLMIEANSEGLPIIPAPWRHLSPLTALRFMSPNAFTSLEMQKVPGGLTASHVKRYGLSRGEGRIRLGDSGERRIRRYEAWLAGKL